MKNLAELTEKQIKLTVKELNEALDEHKIIGQEFKEKVIKELILQNLTISTTLKLMRELNETTISEWQEK